MLIDLAAALALVLVLEGLAIAVLGASLPALLSEAERVPPGQLRTGGAVLSIVGAVIYLAVRG